MKALRSFVVSGVAVLALAGCYTSDDPLIDEANAEYPFPAAVTYMYRDGFHAAVPGSLRREADHYVREQDGMIAQLWFRRIEGNYFLVQHISPETPLYGYGLVEIDGNEVRDFAFGCDPAEDARYIAAEVLSLDDGVMPVVCKIEDASRFTPMLLMKAEAHDPVGVYMIDAAAP